MTSDNFPLCTESAGSTLLLLWQCESGRDVLLCPFLGSLKDVVLGEWHGCPGLGKVIKISLAAACLQLSWLPSQLKAEVTRQQQKTPLCSQHLAQLQPAKHLETETPF